jgi:hypothetical protein
MAWRGKFVPSNPSKYVGDVNGITYRSSLELTLMKVFDTHPDILAWASEEVVIPYRCPTDGKIHRYFPDFLIKKRAKDGTIKNVLIEVKPSQQTKEPKKPKRKTRRYLNEVLTWGKNQAKWKAAEEYCLDRGFEFQILTEKEIRGQKK